MRRTYRRSGGLAVLAAAAAIGLAACGGGPSSPHVASLAPSSSDGSSTGSGHAGGGSTAASSKGNPTRLVDEWAACMRRHGDPGQSDPTIDANKEINVSFPTTNFNIQDLGLGGKTGSNSCTHYMTAASTALSAGYTAPGAGPFNHAQAVKFSECMRANGVADFPDPSGNSLSINQGAGGDLNLGNPTFQKANKRCAKKTGMPAFGSQNSTPQPGSINMSPGS